MASSGISRSEAIFAITAFVVSTTVAYFLYELYHTRTSPIELTFWTFFPAAFVYALLGNIHGILFSLPKSGRTTYISFSFLYGVAWFAYWCCFWYGISLAGATFSLSVLSLMIIATPLATKFVTKHPVDTPFIITSILLVGSVVLGKLDASFAELASREFWPKFIDRLSDQKQVNGMLLLAAAVVFHAVQDFIVMKFNEMTANGLNIGYWCVYEKRQVKVAARHVIFGGVVSAIAISGIVFILYIVFYDAKLVPISEYGHYLTELYLGLVPACILIMYLPNLVTERNFEDSYVMASIAVRPFLYWCLVQAVAFFGLIDLRHDMHSTAWVGMIISLCVMAYIVFPALLTADGFQRKKETTRQSA